jgi:hypothetical protein
MEDLNAEILGDQTQMVMTPDTEFANGIATITMNPDSHEFSSAPLTFQ